MENVENLRKKLGECCNCLSDEQMLQLDMVYRKLAKRLVFQYVAMLRKNRV